MDDRVQYKPDYLKVTSKDKAHPIKNISHILASHYEIIRQSDRLGKNDSRVFGFFNKQFQTNKWVILRFDPYSVDCGFQKKSTEYETRDKALNTAIKYLEGYGYQVKPSDLEAMIDKI